MSGERSSWFWYSVLLENEFNGAGHDVNKLIRTEEGLERFYEENLRSVDGSLLIPPVKNSFRKHQGLDQSSFFTVDFNNEYVIAVTSGQSRRVRIAFISRKDSCLEVYVEDKGREGGNPDYFPCSLARVKRADVKDVSSVSFFYGTSKFEARRDVSGEIE